MVKKASEKKNILIVDDDREILWLLEVLLTGPDRAVTTATNGADALRAAQENPPDLIVLDIMMPGISGWDTLTSLRAFPECARVPVLMVSAKATLDDIDRSLALGANDYVTKPFETEQLRDRVNRLLK